MNYVMVLLHVLCPQNVQIGNARNSKYWKNLFQGDMEHNIISADTVTPVMQTLRTGFYHCDVLYPILKNILPPIVEIAHPNDRWTDL